MQRWISISVVLFLIVLVFGLLVPAVQQAREAARRSAAKNNLKQVGLAAHNYADVHRCFPSGGVIREDGTATQGWMTMYLPYLDASPDYSQLSLDEPWLSAANRSVIETVRPQYLNPEVRSNYTSTGFGLTHYLGNPHLYYRNSSVTFDQMERGTTYTWVTGDVAGEFQPWAYPFNWRPLGTQLCAESGSFGCPNWEGGHLLFADGKVFFFSDETSPEILKQLAAAPPVPAQEQMAIPDKRFETGIYNWEHVPLESQPENEHLFYAEVLKEAGEPLLIDLFAVENLSDSEWEEVMEKRRSFPDTLLIQRIDKTTDLSQVLSGSMLKQAASAQQMQENLKLLTTLQKQMP